MTVDILVMPRGQSRHESSMEDTGTCLPCGQARASFWWYTDCPSRYTVGTTRRRLEQAQDPRMMQSHHHGPHGWSIRGHGYYPERFHPNEGGPAETEK